MDIERLRKIIAYSDANQEDMKAKVNYFFSFAGMSNDKEVLNIMQIVRPSFRKKGYLVLELPFADEEIGALCYKGDSLGYIVLNTSLPKVTINFAICHELYHVLYPQNEFKTKVEFANHSYNGQPEEAAANLFAGMLLLPECSFRFMYAKFKTESGDDEKDTLLRLMNYYQAPYMAVLIRCCELGLPTIDRLSDELLNFTLPAQKERLHELWLDTSILDASQKDDYAHIEHLVNHIGAEYVHDSYLNPQTVEKILQNMKHLYLDIKGA